MGARRKNSNEKLKEGNLPKVNELGFASGDWLLPEPEDEFCVDGLSSDFCSEVSAAAVADVDVADVGFFLKLIFMICPSPKSSRSLALFSA